MAPAVLVTVARVDGSGPREPGAKMLVTAATQFDTIGGGHMEMRACEIARAMLAVHAGTVAAVRKLGRFALGPSLGQCCGGVVHLAFERGGDDREEFDRLADVWHAREDCWRVVALDGMAPQSLFDRAGKCLAGPALPAQVSFDCERPCHVMQDGDGGRWLVDPCLAYRPHLMLFGAGHVGAAIVRALAELPCHVTWVDEREDMFPQVVPANVKIEATDTPEALVDTAAAATSFLVMTHSHALDQRLSEHVLRRTDAAWFGLIGSKIKRLQFERRLRERGISAQRLAEMVCPVGVPGITGKAPAVIAASVCAQLLEVWEAKERARIDVPALRLVGSGGPV
ncbi:MAG: xanthine dehydrogenase accessory protein XdhC [Herminiimonas sp.]|nr:xanthine dehydrogenase accessory protein XdhC [Herminiimonas sp.]